MKKLALLFWILMFAVIMLFVLSVALQTDKEEVVINYYFIDPFTTSVFFLMAVPFISGLLLGGVIMGFSVLKHKRRSSVEKKKLAKIEKEVENLRALPLKDEV